MIAIDAGAIRGRARDVDLARVVLTVLAAAPYLVGWVAARLVTLTIAAALFAVTAVALGYRDVRPASKEKK
ncbi:hypothetical protein Franean1_0271 [Parafrankia sp. EAN1pec]|uniref:hypothetical protein n=1 Tax=Parafrankia sp. (strain EAN1pec) TaxID=298653 RepID=UPI000054131A|nr:hypothetical protein Franean1_0271 [Frankia sp. EAN1pec]